MRMAQLTTHSVGLLQCLSSLTESNQPTVNNPVSIKRDSSTLRLFCRYEYYHSPHKFEYTLVSVTSDSMVCPICITTAILSQTPAITTALGIGGIAKVASDTVKGSAANSKPAGQVVDCCAAGKDTKKASLPRRMIPKNSSGMITKAEVKACCKKPAPRALSATRRP